MIITNPFDVSFAQAILDSIVKSAGVIFSPQTLGIALPFIIKLGIIGSLAFAFLSMAFKGFELMNFGNIKHFDAPDKFSTPPKKTFYEKWIRGKELTLDERRRVMGKVADNL